MNELQLINNPEFGDLRTLEEDGKILFCGADVARALQYANPRKAINDHCKGVTKRDTLTAGGKQEMTFIPEGDVYRLICHSKMEKAEQFERWVFDGVLPTIRKHGLYATNELLDNPDIAIAAFTALKEEREKRKALETTVAIQSQQLAEAAPKVSYYDLILNCKDLISVSKIAKDYGMSAIKMNETLRDLGIQYRQGNVWLLYQKYASQGYTSTKTHEYIGSDGANHAKTATYWTQKGRLFIYNKLKENGIVPMIERGDDNAAT